MINYELMLLEIDEMWEQSTEYKYLPIDTSKEDYEYQMVNYKARRIRDMYGNEYAERYLKENLRAGVKSETLDLCRHEGELPQCSFFCRNYDIVKGCMLNATE